MEINKIVRKHLTQIIQEGEEHITEKGTYMVLQNLQQIMDDIQTILKYKHHSVFPKLVTGEHAWAGDHITTSKDDIEEVANFIKLQIEGEKESNLSENKNPCWKGYKQVGSKKKNGKMVPNCVPINEAGGSAKQAATAINMKKMGVEPKNKSEKEMYEAMEIDESKNCPTDSEKWSASKAAAKAKFDVYPSAYANGWAAKNYKAKGGGWKKCK